MRKVLLGTLAALFAQTALAQSTSTQLRMPAQAADTEEAAPAPEAPYPGSEDGYYSSDRSTAPKAKAAVKQAGMQKFPEDPKPAPSTEIERPKKIDADGNYIYDTKETPPKYSGSEDVQKPIAGAADGSFIYDQKDKPPKFSGNPDLEKPVGMSSNGEYRYKTETHQSHRSASFRLGAITPPSITNPDNGISFATMYGSAPAPLLIGDYEFWHKQMAIGRIGIKYTTGLMVTSAHGYFKEGDASRGGAIPDEHFNFLMIPNTLAGNYQFKYSEKQIIVPFVEAGPGYFTFVEVRDDFKRTKGGGSPTLVGAGGLNFLLDYLDPHAIHELDAQYGINHLWLSLEVRAILGLETDVNFTSASVDCGFILDF